jgi:hypothetical protein
MKGSRRVWRRKEGTRGWVTTKGGQGRISEAENKQSWLGRSSLPQSTSPALLARETEKNKRSDSDLHSCDWGKYVNPEELKSADHCSLKWRAILYCLRQHEIKCVLCWTQFIMACDVAVWEVGNTFSVLCEVWGSHGSDYEDYCLLGCDAVQYGRSLPT